MLDEVNKVYLGAQTQSLSHKDSQVHPNPTVRRSFKGIKNHQELRLNC